MSFKKNLKWSIIGTLFRYIAQSLSIIILARLLTPDEFGLISSSLLLINFVSIIAQLGGCQLVITAPEKKINIILFQSIFTCTLISIIATLLIYVYSGKIYNLFTTVDISSYISVLVWSLLLKGITVSFEGYLLRNSLFKSIAIYDSTSFIFGYFLPSVILAVLNYGVWSLIIATILQPAIYFILVLKKCYHLRMKLRISFENYFETLKKAVSISYIQIISNVSGQVDNFIVSRYLGIEKLGFYTRAYQLMIVPCNLIGQIINRVFLKKFSNIDNESSQTIIIEKSIFLNFIFSMFINIALISFGHEIIKMLLGSGWESLVQILIILSFSIYPRIFYKISEPILIAKNRSYVISKMVTIQMILMCTTTYIAIKYGLIGISLAVLFSSYIYGFMCAIILLAKEKKIIKHFFIQITLNLSLLTWYLINYV
ncbi:oligosaccharide flippase family protein [Moellerella wisconsensis]|uniref:Oligosaccharide flippase family protein n=2 Tax=Gammaproteobacteria TaxID=1236 RepID=A0ACD3Y653_9GAMM|nr:oligosaccharide flippase family protein [Moellerella wisconsensis]UNH38214.1 oligosaccharide flippase family protein [Moellerella wisconsensis]